MDDMSTPPTAGRRNDLPPIVINNLPPKQSWLGRTFFKVVLGLSILVNFYLFGLYATFYSGALTTHARYKSGDESARAKIAVIEISDVILTESVAAPIRELKQAAEDDDVKGVVLRVDSPGGTISGSDELYHAIAEFKQKSGKLVVVSMGAMGTSGAYYVSMPADKIFAERSCITGSIGVIAQLLEVQKLLEDWGVKSEVFKSGKMKDSGSPFRPMTDEERREWQDLIDQMFEQFVAVILKHRKDQIGGEQKLRELADGRVYMAETAQKAGLIDAVGYEDDAIEATKKILGLDKCMIITYERPLGLVNMLTGNVQPPRGLELQKLLQLAAPSIWLLPGFYGPTAPAAE